MKRFVDVRRTAVALLAVGLGFCLAGTASAQVVPHKEKASGTIHVSELISDTVAVQEWSAQGTATHMGNYTQTGSHKVDLLTGEIFDGEFTSVAADGSTASGIYSGTFTLNADGTVRYEVTAIWLEGTGRLEGLEGIGDVTAVATGVAPGSTFRYVTDGEWDLP